MTLLDRIVVTVVNHLIGIFLSYRRKAELDAQASDAATQATQGKPESAEAFIREHGGKK